MQRPSQIRVLVVDDHQRIRLALGQLLATTDGIEVVGFAADGAEAIELVGRIGPDVVLMDVNMPVIDGIEATRRIVMESPGVRVVTMTAFRARQDEARRAGAVAHLLKDAAPEELIHCVRGVATGP